MFARMDVRVTYVFETRGAYVLRAYRPGYCIRISALRRFVANMGRWLARCVCTDASLAVYVTC